MYYCRIIKDDKELIRSNNFERLTNLTTTLNNFVYALDIDNTLLFKLFKNGEEIGFFQLAIDGFVPVNSEEIVIED